jgi:uncharacterized alkaline shock family protein YloU
MALDEDIPRLGCGRRIDEIWAAIDLPPGPHESGCVQCQTARASLRQLTEATRALRRDDSYDAALRPGSSVKDTIMAMARSEVRRGSRIPLHHSGHGILAISEQALTSVVRSATDTLPGVHARRCHVELPAAAGDESAADTTGLRVTLRIAVAAGTDIPDTAETLRKRIISLITAHIGVSAGTINILVEDLYDV